MHFPAYTEALRALDTVHRFFFLLVLSWLTRMGSQISINISKAFWKTAEAHNSDQRQAQPITRQHREEMQNNKRGIPDASLKRMMSLCTEGWCNTLKAIQTRRKRKQKLSSTSCRSGFESAADIKFQQAARECTPGMEVLPCGIGLCLCKKPAIQNSTPLRPVCSFQTEDNLSTSIMTSSLLKPFYYGVDLINLYPARVSHSWIVLGEF